MYKLKEGVILRPFGSLSQIDNSNLTDEIAKFLLSNGRAKESDFEDLKEVKQVNKKNKK